jgi:hypothetical protein
MCKIGGSEADSSLAMWASIKTEMDGMLSSLCAMIELESSYQMPAITDQLHASPHKCGCLSSERIESPLAAEIGHVHMLNARTRKIPNLGRLVTSD